MPGDLSTSGLFTSRAGVDACHLLDALPELRDALPESVQDPARQADAARTERIGPGGHAELPVVADLRLGLGVLVVSGLLCRYVVVAGRTTAELLGPGDLLNPPLASSDPDSLVQGPAHWQALQPTTVAILDRHFVHRAARCPDLLAAIASVGLRRIQGMALRLAIEGNVSVDDRLLLMLWHLADRWGRVTPEGVVVTLPGVTHELLGQLIGTRRPSVTSGLGRLREAGALAASGSGRWVLAGEPPGLPPDAAVLRRTAAR